MYIYIYIYIERLPSYPECIWLLLLFFHPMLVMFELPAVYFLLNIMVFSLQYYHKHMSINNVLHFHAILMLVQLYNFSKLNSSNEQCFVAYISSYLFSVMNARLFYHFCVRLVRFPFDPSHQGLSSN